MPEYIDRGTAIAKLTALEVTEPNATMADAKRVLADIPAADVTPVVHGRWEKWNGDNRHHCTVCECYANAERDSYGYIAYEFLDNYCPNCGADMREKEGELWAE